MVEPLDRLVIMGQSGSGKYDPALILGILPPTRGPSFQAFESPPEQPQAPADRTQSDGLSILWPCLVRAAPRQCRIASGGADQQNPTEIDAIVEEIEPGLYDRAKDQMAPELSGG